MKVLAGLALLALIVVFVVKLFTGPLYARYDARQCETAYANARSLADTLRVDLHPYLARHQSRRGRCGDLRGAPAKPVSATDANAGLAEARFARTACLTKPGDPAQLLITHARVLDVRTGQVAPNRTVVIECQLIKRVLSDAERATDAPKARDTLDANGRLLTPAFVDAHFHSGMLLGDSITPGAGYITHLSTAPDSTRAYRRRFAAAYLPYGVTLVRDLGSALPDLPLLRSWMTRAPDAPDLLPSGAQLVSPEEGRDPPPFQVVVRDSAAAAAQVRRFAAMGFRNIKLYWRLREPALVGALAEAKRLGMNPAAHVDQGILSHDRALDLGVRHFEHVFAIATSVQSPSELETAASRAVALLGGSRSEVAQRPGAAIQYMSEQWRLLGPRDARVLAVIDRLRTTGSTLTPTLHVVGQRVGLAAFPPTRAPRLFDVRGFSAEQRSRAAEGYRIMAGYVAEMEARGVHLAVGSDTEEPGRSVLNEIILLHAAGIPMWRVLRIATLYSAEAVGAGAEYGAVEPGRRADLILFDADPLVEPRAVLRAKTVVKDGAIVHRATGR